MLNIWGVILYLRLPWITAQAGIGMSNQTPIPLIHLLKASSRQNVYIYILYLLYLYFFLQSMKASFFLSFFHSFLSLYVRSDLGDHLAILLYNWDHWSLDLSHCYQRKGQRRSVCLVIHATTYLVN